MRRWGFLLMVVAFPAHADLEPGRLFGGRGSACEFLNKSDSGSGGVRYTSQSLEGDLELKLEGLATRSHISGRRLGGC